MFSFRTIEIRIWATAAVAFRAASRMTGKITCMASVFSHPLQGAMEMVVEHPGGDSGLFFSIVFKTRPGDGSTPLCHKFIQIYPNVRRYNPYLSSVWGGRLESASKISLGLHEHLYFPQVAVHAPTHEIQLRCHRITPMFELRWSSFSKCTWSTKWEAFGTPGG